MSGYPARDRLPSINFDAIRDANPLSSIVGASLKLSRAGNEWKGCCPFHEDRSPSFTIFAGDRRFHCFGCGAAGDVLDYVQRVHGVGARDAAAMLDGGSLPIVVHRALPVEREQDRSEEALAIWRASVPAPGTPVESYLRGRGLWLPIPESLRFTSLPYGSRGPLHPVMIALIASVDNRAVAIQRTYLNASGTGKAAVPKPKLSLGRVKGNAVRLAPAAGELMLTEGIEDALTLQQELGRAAWAAAGAGMLPSMRLPEGVRSVVIGADADDAGERSARVASEKFALEGRTVRIIRPLPPHKDFNSELQEAA